MTVRGRRIDSTHREVFDQFRVYGFVVVETPTTGLKQDKGKPDGFVWHPTCGWQAVEVKGPHTPVRPEQDVLASRANVLRMKSRVDVDDFMYRKPWVVRL